MLCYVLTKSSVTAILLDTTHRALFFFFFFNSETCYNFVDLDYSKTKYSELQNSKGYAVKCLLLKRLLAKSENAPCSVSALFVALSQCKM